MAVKLKYISKYQKENTNNIHCVRFMYIILKTALTIMKLNDRHIYI
jgi:hypothetical protein